MAKKSRHYWPVAYRWLATGVIVAYTAVGSSIVAPLNAQERALGSDAKHALPVRRFEIPAGSLEDALQRFQEQTGWQISAAVDEVKTLSSLGVSGLYTPEQALRSLLSGTGVTHRMTGPGTAALELAGGSISVEVNERAEPRISPKYSEPLRDTPQSISSVSQQTMQQQGATTLRDALRNVAGISLAAGEGGAQGDNLTIRGFAARNDIFIDGMRDFGSYYRDPFNLGEVQVLKGPSSVMFGRGSTGGVVNQDSKTPNLQPLLAGTLSFGTDHTRRVTADINEPLKALGPGAAFRLNLMGHESETAGRDVAENRRFGFAPSLSLGLGTPTRLTFSYLHQAADDTPDYGLPWLFNGPAAVARQNYYGFEDGNFLKTNVDLGAARLEHDWNANFGIVNQARYGAYHRDVRITEARVAGSVKLNTPLDQIQVDRNQIAVRSDETFLQDQVDATIRFRTGAAQHHLIAGAEGGRETSDPTRFTYTGVPRTSLLHPDERQPFAGAATVSSNVNTTAVSAAAYALDTVRVGSHWEFIGGLRWDRFDASYRQAVAPAAAFSRVDNMLSLRGAVVYKPAANGSIYASYGTSFNPSAETLALSAATANVAPEKNRTVEFGSKWDLNHGRTSLRAAVFQTDKTNAREPDPNNAALNVLAGSQRVRGFEAEASGRITNRWQAQASYAYLDSALTRSQYYALAVGSQLANVPANTMSLWNSVELPWHVEAGAGALFVDSRTASSTAPTDPVTGLVKRVPSYWVFNAMMKYPVTDKISLQLNAYNLANRFYYDQLHPAHIIPGPGRSALLGINFRF